MGANDYALIVGIDKYPGLLIDELNGAVNDALAFREWVTDARGGAVPAANTFVFLSRDVPTLPGVQRATSSAIKECLIKSVHAPRRLTPGKRFYLYVSGHGLSSVDQQSLLLTEDATEDERVNFAPRRWADKLYNAGCFEEVVLFFDACRQEESVGYDRTLFEQMPRIGDLSKRRRFYFFSVAHGRLAKEVRCKGEDRGLFSSVLLDGLRGRAPTIEAGPPLRRFVSSSTLTEFVRDMIPYYAKQYGLSVFDNAKIMPDADPDDGIQKLAACDRPLCTEVIFKRISDLNIKTVRVYDQDRPICSVALQTGEARADLPLGLYVRTLVVVTPEGKEEEREGSPLDVLQLEPIHVEV